MKKKDRLIVSTSLVIAGLALVATIWIPYIIVGLIQMTLIMILLVSVRYEGKSLLFIAITPLLNIIDPPICEPERAVDRIKRWLVLDPDRNWVQIRTDPNFFICKEGRAFYVYAGHLEVWPDYHNDPDFIQVHNLPQTSQELFLSL